MRYLNFEGNINFSALIKRIQKFYPQCINFFIKIPDKGIFFGSTPEQLIKKNNNIIKSEAIAGTTKRDNNPNKDLLFENELKNDSKSLEEHEFVVKEIEKILKPKLSKIILSDKPSILKLKNIQHLVTNITGKLKKNIHILELVKGLHPTPAVSGYPVEKASELINKYEEHDRGWYSSPFGWINSDGDGDFCVALRSSLIVGKTIQLFSGGGIVLNSNPDREWEETELKMKTILEIIKDNISYEN